MQYNTILMCVYVLYLLHFFVPSLRQIHSKKKIIQKMLVASDYDTLYLFSVISADQYM